MRDIPNPFCLWLERVEKRNYDIGKSCISQFALFYLCASIIIHADMQKYHVSETVLLAITWTLDAFFKTQ